MGYQIAIDGPVGSGKSSVARELSLRLGFIYIDTGAMYRAAGLFAIRKGIPLSDAVSIEHELDNIDINIRHMNGTQHIFLNGEDISGLIRTQEISNAASKVGAIKTVREKLVDIQRQLASNGDIVMDGRDIGSHVLPCADLKIYLDSCPEVRAGRRYKELLASKPETLFNDVLRDTIERDNYDMSREHSPLICSGDAMRINTDGLDIDGVVNVILEKIPAKFIGKG